MGKNKLEIYDVTDKMKALTNALKYTFVSDMALGYASQVGAIDLRYDEIEGMNFIKSTLLEKFTELETDLKHLVEAIK